MTDFIGKLHPLIVHLPIGILLLNVIFVFLANNDKYVGLKTAIPLTLLLGALSAMAACATGWLLSSSGEYDADILFKHQWLGISVAVLSVLMYIFKKHDNKWIWLVLAGLITVAGHFGGSLTHGENYLTLGNTKAVSANTQMTTPSVTDESLVYQAVIAPILKEKCYACHNDKKQKGKLRLDAPDLIMKGGEDGVVLVAGKPDESALYKRLLLDLNHDDHMPPKGKPQLTNEEIKLLHWWITEGGHFDKKVKDLPKNEAINALMSHNFNKNKTAESELQMIPMQAVEKANQVVLDSLKKWGIAVLPVAPNSNYLSANLVSLMQSSNADVEKLLPLAKQLIWLKLGSIKMDDAALVTVGKLTNLTRLFLNNTDITDAGLQHLSGLTELQYLNLVNTKVTAQGLIPLSKLPNLKQLYVYKTAIKPSDYAQIKSLLPNTVIDTGGYVVPTWASDTSVFKR